MSAAILARDLSFRYGRTEPVLDGLNLEVRPGGRVGIRGGNGEGKTTLVKLVLGLLRPSRGEVSVFGRVPGRWGDGVSIGYIGNPSRNDGESALPLDFRVGDLLDSYGGLFAATGLPLPHHDRLTEGLGLGQKWVRERRIRNLSDGWRQRVIAYLALAKGPELVVADEPTAGLDWNSRSALLQTVRDLADRNGIALLWSSHHYEEFDYLSTDTWELADGALTARSPGAWEYTLAENGTKPQSGCIGIGNDLEAHALIASLRGLLSKPTVTAIHFDAARCAEGNP